MKRTSPKTSLFAAALTLTAFGLWPQSSEAGGPYICKGEGQSCALYVGNDTNLSFFKKHIPEV